MIQQVNNHQLEPFDWNTISNVSPLIALYQWLQFLSFVENLFWLQFRTRLISKFFHFLKLKLHIHLFTFLYTTKIQIIDFLLQFFAHYQI